ncbi:hypothetical protein HPB49_003363 [Dermacentor silvarum]|uniref:Uncharacterized protein n=1 Tax=Dermacentor silvarum TaxID=543639 RepID=A0ACB8DTE1_DERSI|nr:hypothetical protein HPB49_003363 [Dermacentor silvarum]
MALRMSNATTDFLIAYMSNTTRVDWTRVSVMVDAEDIINEQRRAKKRKPVRDILKQRRKFGEYFTLVREMRLGDGQHFFQYFRMSVQRLSRARRTIENTFGILDNRWRILRQDIRASARTLDMIVWATVLLHNYLRTLDEEDHSCFKYSSDNDVDRVGPNGELIPGIWRAELPGNLGILTEVSGGPRIYTGYAKSVRDAFKATFHSPEGCVPWQKKVLSADL